MLGCKYDLLEEVDKQTTLNYHVARAKTGRYLEGIQFRLWHGRRRWPSSVVQSRCMMKGRSHWCESRKGMFRELHLWRWEPARGMSREVSRKITNGQGCRGKEGTLCATFLFFCVTLLNFVVSENCRKSTLHPVP